MQIEEENLRNNLNKFCWKFLKYGMIKKKEECL